MVFAKFLIRAAGILLLAALFLRISAVATRISLLNRMGKKGFIRTMRG